MKPSGVTILNSALRMQYSQVLVNLINNLAIATV